MMILIKSRPTKPKVRYELGADFISAVILTPFVMVWLSLGRIVRDTIGLLILLVVLVVLMRRGYVQIDIEHIIEHAKKHREQVLFVGSLVMALIFGGGRLLMSLLRTKRSSKR